MHYHHGGKHGTVQAHLVLEEPRVLHLDPKAARRLSSPQAVMGGAMLQHRHLKARPHSDTLPPHLLILPLPRGPSTQTHESMGGHTYSNHHREVAEPLEGRDSMGQ